MRQHMRQDYGLKLLWVNELAGGGKSVVAEFGRLDLSCRPRQDIVRFSWQRSFHRRRSLFELGNIRVAPPQLSKMASNEDEDWSPRRVRKSEHDRNHVIDRSYTLATLRQTFR